MLTPRKWLAALCLSTLAIPNTGVGQSAEDEWLDMHSEATQRTAQEREARIHEELANAEADEWTGEYRFGDGLGVNVRLLFAPKAGFVYSWRGCFGQYDLNYGSVEWSDNKLSLQFDRENKRGAFFGLSPEFVPVRWGERHYLLAPDEMIDFANQVNAGFEPCSPCGSFLLKKGDENKSVDGQPDLPTEFKHYILAEPIETRVLSLGETRVVEKWETLRITRLIVDKGSMHGMLPGMELHVSNPKSLFARTIVTKVETQTSEVEIEQSDFEDPLPSVDWEFSTFAFAGLKVDSASSVLRD